MDTITTITATLERRTIACPRCGEQAKTIGPQLHGIDATDLPAADEPTTLTELGPIDIVVTIDCAHCGSHGECSTCAALRLVKSPLMPALANPDTLLTTGASWLECPNGHDQPPALTPGG